MLHFGLIGAHLGHSLSVPIHEAVFRRLGIDADYRLVEIPREALIVRAAALLDELDGFNVTIPYKQDVMPILASLDPAAERIGAVNTIRCGDRAGFNTDAPGFAAMLRLHGMDPAGQRCFVLGTGGASKAIAAALSDMGAAEITLVSRTAREGVIGYDVLPEVFSGLLINCTPAGMWPRVDACPLTEEALRVILPRATGVADIVYNPPQTRLTLAADAAGVPACTGLAMLIAQAVEAEKRWLAPHGIAVPDDMTDILLKELKLL